MNLLSGTPSVALLFLIVLVVASCFAIKVRTVSAVDLAVIASVLPTILYLAAVCAMIRRIPPLIGLAGGEAFFFYVPTSNVCILGIRAVLRRPLYAWRGARGREW